MELYALEPTVLLHNRYEILAPIGSGGFSVLYKAYDHEMDAVVAIKEYFPSAIAERIPHSRDVTVRNDDAGARFRKGLLTFREEARRMAELGGLHNTVDVLQTFDENNTGYIVMELLTGQTLLQYLQTLPNGRYTDIEDAKKIICLVAEALAYAHSKKILHRDVSPDNIFLCSDGRVKLIDFGAARELKEDAALSVVVKAGCTPPEQYRKNGRQGPWTDLYALGATFYRMLTGTYPETAPDRAFGDRECPAPSVINPAVPPYIDALLARCLAYDYTLRVARASEVIEVLRAEKKLPQPAQILQKRRALRRTTYILVSICLVLFLLIALVIYKQSENLYNIRIAPCTIVMEIPTDFSEESGLLAAAADFQTMYPAIEVRFVPAGTDGADICVFADDTMPRASLSEIQSIVGARVQNDTVTLGYDAQTAYLNLEKAYAQNVPLDAIETAADIPPEYWAESYDAFLEQTGTCYAWQGSVTRYRDIQTALPGMYRVLDCGTSMVPVRFCVRPMDGEKNQIHAAMRFLLYLMSERAQEILFVQNAGIVPAEEGQRAQYFAVFNELAFLQ